MSNECLLKSSATTHAQLLDFLHYSQGSSFFLFAPLGDVELFVTLIHVYACGVRDLWSVCWFSKIYLISLIVCKTIKNCEQYCKQQLVNIILVINWLILAPISLYIFSNTNIVWGLFLVKRMYFSFILSVMPYLDYKISVCYKLQVQANLVYCTGLCM